MQVETSVVVIIYSFSRLFTTCGITTPRIAHTRSQFFFPYIILSPESRAGKIDLLREAVHWLSRQRILSTCLVRVPYLTRLTPHPSPLRNGTYFALLS